MDEKNTKKIFRSYINIYIYTFCDMKNYMILI